MTEEQIVVSGLMTAVDGEGEAEKQIARWVYHRFSREAKCWNMPDPDEAAFESANTPDEYREEIMSVPEIMSSMIDVFMDYHVSAEWRTLMAVLVAESQIRKKLMEPIKDADLDADKQQKSYMLKADLADILVKMRERNSKLSSDVMGMGVVGDKAARMAAADTKKKVTPEGRSRKLS